MPEGLLGGIIGEEANQPEVEAPAASAGADAVALAVATDAAKQDPELARKAGAYLDVQQALARLQIKHFGVERELAIAAAKRKRFADRLRNYLLAGLVFIVTGAIAGFTWLAVEAVRSRQVLVAPFNLSPALATRNLTGRIVAAGVLDELSRVQMATRSATQKSQLANAWERELRIDVPDAGVSINEVIRALRERFGHDVQIDGDLVETPAHGLALTVRGTDLVPKTFYGTESDLEALTRQSAEYIFGQARPALWAAYLNNHDRFNEAIAFARANIVRTQGTERARLLNMWADATSYVGPMHEARALARASVEVNPDDWGSRADVIEFTAEDGDEEGAWRAGVEMMQRAGGRPGRAPEIQYAYWDEMTFNLQAERDAIAADLLATHGEGTNFGAAWAVEPTILALQHDPAGADRALGMADIDDTKASERALRHWIKLLLAADRSDWATAANEGLEAREGFRDPLVPFYAPGLGCAAAVAQEHAGRSAEADQSFAMAAQPDSVACQSYRADVLDLRGDWVAARRLYAQAVMTAPDLPFAYYSWGLALAGHGELSPAIAKLEAAHQRGPHWADPLKYWGDVLMKQGNAKEALVKYDEALKYAPNWKQLKEAREAAAKLKS
jgi:tetratricopeptide (TPR) repeat protein